MLIGREMWAYDRCRETAWLQEDGWETWRQENIQALLRLLFSKSWWRLWQFSSQYTPRGQERGCVRWVRKGWTLWGIQQRRCRLSSWLHSFSYWEILNVGGAWSGTPLVERFPVCWTNQRPSLLLCSSGCPPLCPSLDHLPLTDYLLGWTSPHQKLSDPHPDLDLVACEDYHKRSYSGWIHAVHPRGSFPCLHCE